MSETNSFYRHLLSNSPEINQRNGLFYQTSQYQQNDFEKHYTKLRQHEGRLYSIGEVRRLPAFAGQAPLQKEWQVRARSSKKLIEHLRNQSNRKILEVGCGNGWLMNTIQVALNADCCGIDVNETELLQGVEAFGMNERLTFFYADILSDLFNDPIADAIIVASAIQYFPDPQKLIQKLLTLLSPGGQIHIIDSPFYDHQIVPVARRRSQRYFQHSGSPEMSERYFHHSWEVLSTFKYRIVHNPKAILNRVLRPLNNNSPFPWVVIFH